MTRIRLVLIGLPMLLLLIWLSDSARFSGINGRGLQPNEIHALRPLFGGQVDYTAVRVHAVTLPKRMTAVVLGNRIFYRRGYYLGDFSRHPQRLPVLAHELTHVWQYRQHGWAAMWLLLREHLLAGSAVYGFDRERLGQTALSEFGLEAQGQIVAEYLARQHSGLPVADFQATLAATLPLDQPASGSP